MSNTRVRRRAVAANGVALLVAGVTVGAAVDDGRYVYLAMLAHPFAGVLVAGVVVAATGQLLVSHRAAALIARLIGGVVALACLAMGLAASTMADVVEPERVGVAAQSQAFAIVTYRYPGSFHSGHLGLRLRTRAGLASRQASVDLACFAVPRSGAGPEWLLETVRFAGPHELEIRLRDDTTQRQTFNPRTLRVDHTVDRCTGAPDPLGDD